MRRDIQFLRGLAVLLVVLYHANVGVVRSGYLGVDVFFVISGFLITSIILKSLDANNFSFSRFYLRRAKRLLPALYCTLSVTALFSYIFIAETQWGDFVAQLYSSLTFSSNFVLPTQVGYFESNAEGKPLLHIWSLSLEEQYYFLLPVLLLFTPSSKRGAILAALALMSVLLCFIWVSGSASGSPPPILWRFSDATLSEWAFYLFPTRAWELLSGSICAWLMLNRPVEVPAKVKFISLLTIIFISFISFDPIHPRGDALLVVIATSLILLGNREWLVKGRVVFCMEKMGDWSYSIYLVHWPLFAFSFLGYAGQVPFNLKLLLIIAAITLGYAQYRLVETPFRYGWSSQRSKTWMWLALSTIVVFATPVPMLLNGLANDRGHSVDYAEIRQRNYGLSEKCNKWVTISGVDPECMTTDKPKIAVWGDSYAMHLVPGLLVRHNELIQLTKSVCGPILGISPIFGRYKRGWAEKCAQSNQLALKNIIEHDSITHVVLGSTFGQYFKGTDGYFLVNGEVEAKESGKAIAALIETVEQLKGAGKIPVIFSPPPRSGFNIGECLERQDMGLISFREHCKIGVSNYVEYEREIRAALKEVEAKTGIRVIWLNEHLCGSEWCETRINKTYIYRDGGHLSVSGSKELLGEFILKE